MDRERSLAGYNLWGSKELNTTEGLIRSLSFTPIATVNLRIFTGYSSSPAVWFAGRFPRPPEISPWTSLMEELGSALGCCSSIRNEQ